MNPSFTRALTLTFLAMTLVGCLGRERPTPPPDGENHNIPWGAVSGEVNSTRGSNPFSEEVVDELARYVEAHRQEHPGTPFPYDLLALSGGGSRGAFGAGVLKAWSDQGTRPEFSVVTGISTGALMATAAFLGPAYDDQLSRYRDVTNEDIFIEGGRTGLFTRVAIHDTSPLQALLREELPDEMIREVGRAWLEGRRLFIGTTNLDADVFTIWDMGKIASSDRPERFDLYRDIVLASASFPSAFPPVYLPAQAEDGSVYQQMHVDGGVKETVFLYDYLADLKRVAKGLGVNWEEEVKTRVWLINNGKITRPAKYDPVEPKAMSIALRSVDSLMRGNAASSLYFNWTRALAEGATVSLIYISENVDAGTSLDFDPETMERLYQLGYESIRLGTGWHTQSPPGSLEEFMHALRVSEYLEPLNAAEVTSPSSEPDP